MTGDAGGIGARLRAGREKLGLTVLQAAEKLHVDPRILESLESENFTALGAPVYARGHLRHYAELVGESAAQLNELYSVSSAAADAQPDLTRIAKAPPPAESNKLIVPALFVLAVFAVAGAVWWVLSLAPQPMSTSDGSPSLAVPQSGETHSVPPPGASAPGAPAGTPANGKLTHGSDISQGQPGAPGTRLASAAGSLVGGDSGRASNTRPAATAGSGPGPAGSAVEAGSPTSPATAAPVPHASREQQVTLRFSADCWTEVYDASGARLFYDVGAGGTVRTLKGTAPLRIVLANASGVSLDVDGRGTPINKLTHPDGSAEFLISRSGRIVRARSATDGD